MKKPLHLIGAGLPLTFAIATVVVEFSKGSPHPVTLVVASSAAACLGLALVFLLRGMLVLSGQESAGDGSVSRRRRGVEADLHALERTLEGIALDVGINRVSEREADELAAPLRDRVDSLERELALLRGLELEGVDGEIEAEVRARLEARQRGSAEPASGGSPRDEHLTARGGDR